MLSQIYKEVSPKICDTNFQNVFNERSPAFSSKVILCL